MFLCTQLVKYLFDWTCLEIEILKINNIVNKRLIMGTVFVAWKLNLLSRYYHSFIRFFLFGTNLTSSRNQIQMAPAYQNCWLLHSVHLQEVVYDRCVGTNCPTEQEPIWIWFLAWFTGFSRRESNEAKH